MLKLCTNRILLFFYYFKSNSYVFYYLKSKSYVFYCLSDKKVRIWKKKTKTKKKILLKFCANGFLIFSFIWNRILMYHIVKVMKKWGFEKSISKFLLKSNSYVFIILNPILMFSFILRGYCTPDQFFDCLRIFLKNLNTLVTSKICFL